MRLIGWLAYVGAFALLVVAMITGTAPATAGQTATVTGAWVRLPAVPGRPAAGYFVVAAGGSAAELVAVSAPGVRIELHSMSMAGDVMRMDRLASVRVLPGRSVRFAPGASHLMLFGLDFHAGATVPLTFAFADGSKLTATAAVVAAGSDPPHGAR